MMKRRRDAGGARRRRATQRRRAGLAMAVRRGALSPAMMMRPALAEAYRAATGGEVPVGAAIYRAGRLLAAAGNRREHLGDPTAHAEMLVIRAAAELLGDWRLNDCTLAVTLEPCPMCAGAIVNARVGRLIYGAGDPKMGAVRSLHRLCDDRRFNHRLPVLPGVMADECAKVLTDFFRPRRIKR
jgi:tRNA(adenine34) deaminase